jgi:hypothetical protein
MQTTTNVKDRFGDDQKLAIDGYFNAIELLL